MENIVIRNATVEDAQALLDIYSYYVKNTAISFEYEVPSLEEFRNRIRNTLKKYPYLCILKDGIINTLKKYPYLCILKDGIIKGYAYAGAFVGRAAYDWSAEMTVYIAHDARKCGLGRRIYEALEAALKEMGILNLYACIGYPDEEDQYLTKNSAQFHQHMGYKTVGEFHNSQFHQHMGYKTVGEFHNCGYKFDRWYNMIWMEKNIGEHGKNQSAVKDFISGMH